MTAVGVYRRLQTLSTDGGQFNILAVDHRDALRSYLDPNSPATVAESVLIETKMRLVAHLGDMASAVMLEPEFSIAQTISAGVLPPNLGFTAAIEAQGYLADPTTSTNATLPGWSVGQAATAGAAAAKILVLWDPSDPDSQAAQTRWISGIVDECHRHDLPLLLEPIIRQKAPFDAHLAMVEHMSALGPTILKLAIPADEDRFHLLDQAASAHPWVLLSAGVEFSVFADQVAKACTAGASGFAVGRALWGDYLKAPEHQSEGAIATMISRLRSLCDITAASATPWTERVEAPRADSGWFLEGGA